MMKFILVILLSIPAAFASQQNELTLYFVPSPVGMDWSSPAKLAWSAIKNRLSFKPRFMGHVFVELTCGENRELTGMTGIKFDYLNQLLVEQRGLGILYHSFEGGLEEKDKVIPELNEFLETGYVNFTRFLLNSSQCQRLTQYLKEYRDHNIGRFYGLANRPLYGEGAGCSAFGASFVNVLDIMDEEMRQNWSQSVLIPLNFSGPPLRDEGVSLFKLMLNAHRWAKSDERHQLLTFWDPDKMYQWVKKKVAHQEATYPVLKIKNSEGIVVDKSHFPSPQSPIWLQSTDLTYQKK